MNGDEKNQAIDTTSRLYARSKSGITLPSMALLRLMPLILGTTISLLPMQALADAAPLPIRKLFVNDSHNLVIEYTPSPGVFPAKPSVQDFKGASHRLVLDFPGSVIDRTVMPSAASTLSELTKAFPDVRGIRYAALTGGVAPTARIVLDLAQSLQVAPHVVAIGESSVTIDLGVGEAGTPQNEAAQATPAATPALGAQPGSTALGNRIQPSQIAGESSEPATASQPDKANEPVTASQPDKANEPVTASQPVRAKEPVTASQPEKANEPATASQPDKANELTTASQPEKANEPATASQPEKANEPGKSGEAGKGASPIDSSPAIATSEPIKAATALPIPTAMEPSVAPTEATPESQTRGDNAPITGAPPAGAPSVSAFAPVKSEVASETSILAQNASSSKAVTAPTKGGGLDLKNAFPIAERTAPIDTAQPGAEQPGHGSPVSKSSSATSGSDTLTAGSALQNAMGEPAPGTTGNAQSRAETASEPPAGAGENPSPAAALPSSSAANGSAKSTTALTENPGTLESRKPANDAEHAQPDSESQATIAASAGKGYDPNVAREAAAAADMASEVNGSPSLDNTNNVASAVVPEAVKAEGAVSPPVVQKNGANRAEAEKHFKAAVKFHMAGDLPAAIAEYKATIAVNPHLPEPYCNLGLIYNQQHNFQAALDEFHKALAVNPKDAITYNGVGAALRAQKDLVGAIKNWQTAVKFDPKLATAHYNLGTAYEIEKEYDKALNAYKQAVAQDSHLGEAYYRMGLILQRKNDPSQAVEEFNKALKASTKAEYSADARQRIALLSKKMTR